MAVMERRGDNINVAFQPVTSDFIRVQSEQMEVISENTPPDNEEKITFGPRLDASSAVSDLKKQNTVASF